MRAPRHELKLKALRAAAGVALFSGAIGCGTADTDQLEKTATARDAGPGVTFVRDAGPRDAGTPETGVLADAGFPDAGFATCDNATMGPEEYIACCEAIGWDWNRGCAAWGPPAPPAMEIA